MALKKLRKKMGIRSKFVIMLGAFGLIALMAMGYGAYWFSLRRTMAEAETKANVIFSYIMAQRAYFNQYQRPLINALVEKDRFYPELMSQFGITRRTLDLVKDELSGYIFKQASMNPMWPENKADLQEEKLITTFRSNRKIKELDGMLEKDGKTFYYMAKPVRGVGKYCLRCHGKVEDAPKDLIEVYGKKAGRPWKAGEIPAAYVVYVPMDEAINDAKQTAAELFVIGAAIMLVALFGIWLFLDYRIVKPLTMLSEMTEEVSVGKNMDRTLYSDRMKDEVGTLAKSVDRLRVSMVKMLKRRQGD